MSASRSRSRVLISAGRGRFLRQAAVGMSGASVVTSTEAAACQHSWSARNSGYICHCLDDF